MTTRVIAYFPSPPRGVWHLGPLPIRAYAVFIIIGIVAALLIGDRRWEARGGERGVIYDIALWAVPFGLIGGRLYHLATDWRTYFGEGGAGVGAALRIWDGGLGIWGAVALGGVGAWIACRRRGIPLPAFGDAIAPGIVLAQAIGRLGNYFNQELFGRETTMPWGLEVFYRRDPAGFVDVHSLDGVSTGQLAMVVQPTFLYELLWNLVVFAVLIYLDRRFAIGHGRLFALYVAGYCIGRFCIELLRDDAATHIAGIRINSFTSTFVLIGAVVYLILAPKGREDPATLSASAADRLVPDSVDEATTESLRTPVVAATAVDESATTEALPETTSATAVAKPEVEAAAVAAEADAAAEVDAVEAESARAEEPAVEAADVEAEAEEQPAAEGADVVTNAEEVEAESAEAEQGPATEAEESEQAAEEPEEPAAEEPPEETEEAEEAVADAASEEPEEEPAAEAEESEQAEEEPEEPAAEEPPEETEEAEEEPVAEAPSEEPEEEPVAEAPSEEPEEEPAAEAEEEPAAEAEEEPEEEPVGEASSEEAEEPVADAASEEPEEEPAAEAKESTQAEEEPVAEEPSEEPEEPVAEAPSEEPEEEPAAEAEEEPVAEEESAAEAASAPDAEAADEAEEPTKAADDTVAKPQPPTPEIGRFDRDTVRRRLRRLSSRLRRR